MYDVVTRWRYSFVLFFCFFIFFFSFFSFLAVGHRCSSGYSVTHPGEIREHSYVIEPRQKHELIYNASISRAVAKEIYSFYYYTPMLATVRDRGFSCNFKVQRRTCTSGTFKNLRNILSLNVERYLSRRRADEANYHYYTLLL